METTWDKLRAVVFALCVHAFALALLFVGLWWQPASSQEPAEGPMIEATLVSSPQQSAAVAKAIKAAAQPDAHDATPPPQPRPEPKPQDAPQPQQLAPQVQLPKPDTVNQDEVRRVAELAAEQKKQEQEERRKQAQVDLTNKQQQQQEAENRQRLAQQQIDQQKQLADIRKQRADAERQVKLAEQKMKQLQNQDARFAQYDAPPAPVLSQVPAHPPAGNAGDKAGLQAKYLDAIRQVVVQNWHTSNVPERVVCKVHFKQLPGGEVFFVDFPDCPYDAAGQASVKDALQRTPLPYTGFETVFEREGNIKLCYPEDACK